MAGLRGNLGTIAGLKQRIAALPVSVAHAVAQQAAPALTTLARAAYESGRNVYGDARPVGADGAALTLEKTGRTHAGLRFVSIGTVMRCDLPTPWAKYLIGKYQILPNGGLPAAWTAGLGQVVARLGALP